MSALEEMAREHLHQIIARAELRAEQQSIHANSLAPYGAEAKRAQRDLALMLAGLEKLKGMLTRFSEPTSIHQFSPSTSAIGTDAPISATSSAR
jgi:hypothetical protein